MIGTAVDTNILSEILIGGPRAIAAAQALADALSVGPVLASGVVYAELCAVGPEDSVYRLLTGMGIEVDTQMPLAVLDAAASAWQRYVARRQAVGASYHCAVCGQANEEFRCTRCGARIGGPRHILADFLIGAHASVVTSALLTWDRGIYCTYFANLTVKRPSA